MRVRPKRSTRHSKTQYLIAAFVPALIVTFSITGFVWASNEVTVVEDGRTRQVEIQSSDVAGALAESGVELADADVVTPPLDTDIRAGQVIVVRHAKRVVLRLGKDAVNFEVVGETVADALVAAGIDPTANPAVSPALGTSLKPGMSITVPDVFVRVEQQESSVAAKTVKRTDYSLAPGQTRLVRRGRAGRLLKVYRVIVVGGVETTRVLSASHVVDEPLDSVVAIGTARRVVAVSSAASATRHTTIRRTGRLGHGRRLSVTATGYSAAQPGLSDHTATGADAGRGVIAVDPSVIALGTHVFVPGYGYAVAADTGGSVRGNNIDLCFDTVAEALAWGRRTVTIVILD